MSTIYGSTKLPEETRKKGNALDTGMKEDSVLTPPQEVKLGYYY